MAEPVSTYSIVACDLERGQWGVATQSKFLAVGSIVPWAEPQAGAIATQSYANPRYGPDGLALLRQGLSAEDVVSRLTEADDGREQRQLVLVDLRVDDHQAPIEELRRLHGLHRQLFGSTPRDEWLPVDDELRAELDEHLARLGYERLEEWAGAANLEERVDGDDEIDPVVLNELRRRR